MMPMFHQGGRASVLLGFSGSGISRQKDGFTYNDSPYVHGLNRTLQLEQAAIALYTARIRAGQDFSTANACHHHAYRQLVRLIFAQRGLPDSDPVSFTAVTTTLAARASRWIPGAVHTTVLDAGAHRIESALWDRYSALLLIAPDYDRKVIEELLEQTRDFSTESL